MNDNLSGDGRVSSESATGGGRQLDAKVPPFRIEYVHGSQIADPIFRTSLVDRVVKPIGTGLEVVAATEFLGSTAERAARYRARGPFLPWREVRSLLDPAPVPRIGARSQPETLNSQKSTVVNFNRKLFGADIPPPENINASRAAYNVEAMKISGATADQNLRFVSLTEIMIEAGVGSEGERIQDLARIGNALVKAGSYVAALSPLGTALDSWDRIPIGTYSKKGREAIEDLRKITSKNFGIALFESGQCEDGVEWLRWHEEEKFARDRLFRRCKDKISGESR